MPDSPNFGTLDLTSYGEDLRLSFYGALFAIAFADQSIDESESRLISDSLHLEDLSDEARRAVLAQAISPPDLDDCLNQLEDADDDIKRALMLNLVDVVLADDSIEPGEHEGLRNARERLDISEDLIGDMHDVAYRANEARSRGKFVQRPLRFVPADEQETA